MSDAPGIDVFETVRPKLMGLAYRMLSSMADAEDAVQDTYLKWQSTDRAGILNPEAFLTTVCTNCCLDTLKAAHRKRVDYVGPWIPEPQLWQDPVPSPHGDLIDEADASALKSAILDSGSTIAQLIGVAWSSVSSFRVTDYRGGANGAALACAAPISKSCLRFAAICAALSSTPQRTGQ